jgi:sugar lactone lactonase YvrE
LAGSIGNSGYTDATGTNALFNFPLGIATDGTNVYVADSGNNVIRKIVISSGVTTTLAGNTSGTAGYTNAVGTAAYFNSPTGLTYGAGYLYVVDQSGTHVRTVVTTTGGTLGTTTTLY